MAMRSGVRMQINILDIGIGNPQSVFRMLEELDANAKVLSSPSEMGTDLENVILTIPGVGSWDKGMERLESLGWVDYIHANLRHFRLLLGICLGMQLFFKSSAEGSKSGLGILDGHVSFTQNLKNINIGWRKVRFVEDVGFSDSRFYHVHRFSVRNDGQSFIKGFEENGAVVCVQKDNITGFQFHPEKSHYYGKTLFKEILDKYA